MPLNKAIFWKVRDAGAGRHVRLHLLTLGTAVEDLAILRVVNTVDHVEHRALAGTVGADDGAHFVLADVE